MDIPPLDISPKDTPPLDILPKDTPPKDTPPLDILPKDTPPEDISPKDTPPEDISPKDTPPLDILPKDTPPKDTSPKAVQDIKPWKSPLFIHEAVEITDIGYATETFTFDPTLVDAGDDAILYNKEGVKCGTVALWSEFNMPEDVDKDDIPDEYWDNDDYLLNDCGGRVYVFKVAESVTIETGKYYTWNWCPEFGELRENSSIKLTG